MYMGKEKQDKNQRRKQGKKIGRVKPSEQSDVSP
jgi:hypothetical protein